MSLYLGLDTSNYTTSIATFDGSTGINCSQLLPVKEGSLGLRQSDAVFHHTVQLPELIRELFENSLVTRFMIEMKKRNVPMDFYSWHIFLFHLLYL